MISGSTAHAWLRPWSATGTTRGQRRRNSAGEVMNSSCAPDSSEDASRCGQPWSASASRKAGAYPTASISFGRGPVRSCATSPVAPTMGSMWRTTTSTTSRIVRARISASASSDMAADRWSASVLAVTSARVIDT